MASNIPCKQNTTIRFGYRRAEPGAGQLLTTVCSTRDQAWPEFPSGAAVRPQVGDPGGNQVFRECLVVLEGVFIEDLKLEAVLQADGAPEARARPARLETSKLNQGQRLRARLGTFHLSDVPRRVHVTFPGSFFFGLLSCFIRMKPRETINFRGSIKSLARGLAIGKRGPNRYDRTYPLKEG